MDRKTFLRWATGSTLGLGAYAAGCGASEGADPNEGQVGADDGGSGDDVTTARRLPALGVQLYTVRTLMSESVEDALRSVAEVGYDEVEFAGYFDLSPDRIRDLVAAHDLQAVSAHVPIEALRDDFDGVVAAATTIGHRYVVVPYLAEEERTSADDYRRLAVELNELGRRCRAAGVVLGYHNHAFELAPLDQTRGLDILVDETDPDLVTFELDLYWTAFGGADPAEYLRSRPGRFRLCHVKDMDAERRMVDVGDGIMDWGAIFAEAETGGIEHFFVEHDQPADPLATIARSHDYLAQLRF